MLLREVEMDNRDVAINIWGAIHNVQWIVVLKPKRYDTDNTWVTRRLHKWPFSFCPPHFELIALCGLHVVHKLLRHLTAAGLIKTTLRALLLTHRAPSHELQAAFGLQRNDSCIPAEGESDIWNSMEAFFTVSVRPFRVSLRQSYLRLGIKPVFVGISAAVETLISNNCDSLQVFIKVLIVTFTKKTVYSGFLFLSILKSASIVSTPISV